MLYPSRPYMDSLATTDKERRGHQEGGQLRCANIIKLHEDGGTEEKAQVKQHSAFLQFLEAALSYPIILKKRTNKSIFKFRKILLAS